MQLPKIYKEDPTYSMPRVFLSDEVYSQALDAFIIVCTDVVVINKENKILYLTYRKAIPANGWWIIGGRIYAGESFEESIIRCMERETKLKLPPDRFVHIIINRYNFTSRAQAPQDKGCDTMSFTFYVELTEEELKAASANLDSKEYETSYGLRPFSYEELIEAKVHPMILDLYCTIFPQQKLD